MLFLRLILRNAFRHRLRALLTVVGIAVAVTAFGLLRTLVGVWYLGAETASPTRLVTRNAVSLVFPLPLAYYDRIRQVAGITNVSYGNWFGGIYIDERHFFPNYAVEPRSYLALYPEFVLSEREYADFLRDRNGCIVGRQLANRFGWQVGDLITLRGTIFPGQWQFVLRGIYHGADRTVEERIFLFHWDYLNETMKRTAPHRADQVGFYITGVKSPDIAPEVAAAVDGGFRSSRAETLTETERSFQLSFVAMTEAIVIAIRLVSYVVILIIMVVAANTMAMTARERSAEYATMKALGFGPRHIGGIVFGESLFIAAAGGALGVLFTFPAAHWIETQLVEFFPRFGISPETILLQSGAALIVGAAAGIFPTWRASTGSVAEGLRRIG
jgi:putative ABC transport system permease protein